MNEVEKQILANQCDILQGVIIIVKNFIREDDLKVNALEHLFENLGKTKDLLLSKIKDESACDMSNLDEMDAEEDGCSCGFKKGKNGCGKVIDEIVYRDDDGEITDTEWVHCGEGKELCDECIEKQDAIGGNKK